MKVVVDTNILVSAILKDRDPEIVIRFVAESNDIEWIVSQEIMTECREVLARPKFGLPDYILKAWFSLLDCFTRMVSVDFELDFPRDQKDAKFLTCAIVVGADYFISGDHDFQQAQKLLTTTILSVSQFKKLVFERIVTR